MLSSRRELSQKLVVPLPVKDSFSAYERSSEIPASRGRSSSANVLVLGSINWFSLFKNAATNTNIHDLNARWGKMRNEFAVCHVAWLCGISVYLWNDVMKLISIHARSPCSQPSPYVFSIWRSAERNTAKLIQRNTKRKYRKKRIPDRGTTIEYRATEVYLVGSWPQNFEKGEYSLQFSPATK